MASIWRHPNSKYWTACYTDESGRQVKKTTKQTDRNKALEIALELEHTADQARQGVLTEAKCREILSGILERTTGAGIRYTPTRTYLDTWLEGKKAAKAAGTAERYENTVNLFLKFLGNRANRPLIAITASDIQGFVNQRVKDGSAPKTVVVDAKTLNNVFNLARRQGLIPNNPVEAIELPAIESSERDVFTPAQVKLLVDAAKTPSWKTLILLGYFTGARLGDCVKMKWENLDLAKGVMRFMPQKTRRQTKKKPPFIEIPIHPELQSHLEAIASTDKPEVFLCPELAAKGSGGQHGLSESFKVIMRRAGLETGLVAGMGKRKFSRQSFHSLRHSFNSALANAGVSQELRMKLTGHSTAAVNTRYTHHELAPLREAVGRVPSLQNPATQANQKKRSGKKAARKSAQ
ncbi:MAG: tyrosine-type recombinase/integrase [Verrucomicrobia bacterium]|jgi:integrase|nr:tyrosine-type recombinase/integrase [Verrucomicrobiota bacterium]